MKFLIYLKRFFLIGCKSDWMHAMKQTIRNAFSAYHFESKESIEASLVMEPVPSEDDVAPSGCLAEAAEPSPV